MPKLEIHHQHSYVISNGTEFQSAVKAAQWEMKLKLAAFLGDSEADSVADSLAFGELSAYELIDLLQQFTSTLSNAKVIDA